MIFKKVVENLKLIHEKGFIYRDLKPDNVLISKKGEFLLTDFEFSIHLYLDYADLSLYFLAFIASFFEFDFSYIKSNYNNFYDNSIIKGKYFEVNLDTIKSVGLQYLSIFFTNNEHIYQSNKLNNNSSETKFTASQSVNSSVPKKQIIFKEAEIKGSIEYLSPEVFTKNLFSLSSDIWALGCFIYDLFFRKAMFKSSKIFLNSTHQKDYFKKKILNFSPSLIFFDEDYKDAQNLFNQILQKNPFTRLGSESLNDILSHKWLLDERLLSHKLFFPYIPINKNKYKQNEKSCFYINNVDYKFNSKFLEKMKQFEKKKVCFTLELSDSESPKPISILKKPKLKNIKKSIGDLSWNNIHINKNEILTNNSLNKNILNNNFQFSFKNSIKDKIKMNCRSMKRNVSPFSMSNKTIKNESNKRSQSSPRKYDSVVDENSKKLKNILNKIKIDKGTNKTINKDIFNKKRNKSFGDSIVVKNMIKLNIKNKTEKKFKSFDKTYKLTHKKKIKPLKQMLNLDKLKKSLKSQEKKDLKSLLIKKINSSQIIQKPFKKQSKLFIKINLNADPLINSKNHIQSSKVLKKIIYLKSRSIKKKKEEKKPLKSFPKLLNSKNNSINLKNISRLKLKK